MFGAFRVPSPMISVPLAPLNDPVPLITATWTVPSFIDFSSPPKVSVPTPGIVVTPSIVCFFALV